MPPRVQKEFLVVVRDQEHYESLINHDSNKLTIIDIYQPWSGPCSLLSAAFRSVALKLNDCDNRLQFLAVGVDRVPSLASHQSSSEPKFLFLTGGRLVAEVVGGNFPKILGLLNRYLPSSDMD